MITRSSPRPSQLVSTLTKTFSTRSMSTAAVLRVAARSSSQTSASSSSTLIRSQQRLQSFPAARNICIPQAATRGGYGGRGFSTSVKRDSGAAHDPHAEETFEEFTIRYEKEFDAVTDVFELQRNLNNAFCLDLVPSPSVCIAALKAARRVNDFPTAVRIFEGLKVKTENRMQYEEYLEELRPLREELGIPLQEDMYPGQLIAHVLDKEYGVGFGPDAKRKKEEDERKRAEREIEREAHHPVTS